ncbi:DL-endopeptidase inhibitor IseA family protein [Bacillus solimangrovi]|uniref:Uncharacterized protein n=1 Tax=Bacillus solimangrovi TaxID=1305675 RepID=A0A1E5LEN9_9BACI|nr:DL-endopeptidase inhibitor IseA family protein [Bacillus solimangrovi]OEH92535.1 hypothetical protein BFG57_15480 [Bacillus solimangrovi]
MKKIFMLFSSLTMSAFLLTACTSEVISTEDYSNLKQENEKLQEKNKEMNEEIESYKEQIEELKRLNEKILTSNNEVIKDDFRDLILDGQKRFFHVSNGGEVTEDKTFEYDGMVYRYLGDDLKTEDKLIAYLEVAYTPTMARELIKRKEIIEYNGWMAQPDADYGSLLEWDKLLYKGIELDGTSILLTLHVPFGDRGDFSEETVELKYEEGMGWLLNSHHYKEKH